MSKENAVSIKISIIIPSFNSERTIRDCLRSVLSQNYPKEYYEVIVVDDGSDDASKDLISQFPVRLVSQARRGPSAARNLGLRHAKGELIIFLDSDCIVEPDWISSHVMTHLSEDTGSDFVCVGGSVALASWRQNFFEICDYYSSWYEQPKCNSNGGQEYEYLPTTNLSIWKETINKIGGFNEELLCGEDIDLGQRLRNAAWRQKFAPWIIAYHCGRGNLKSYLFHHYYWGLNAAYFRKFGSGLRYHYLFYPNIFLHIFLFPWIAIGYTLYVISKWFPKNPILTIIVSPLIFLSKIAYAYGNLKTINLLSKRKHN